MKVLGMRVRSNRATIFGLRRGHCAPEGTRSKQNKKIHKRICRYGRGVGLLPSCEMSQIVTIHLAIQHESTDHAARPQLPTPSSNLSPSATTSISISRSIDIVPFHERLWQNIVIRPPLYHFHCTFHPP